MKAFAMVALVALLVLNAALFLKQRRLEQQIEALQSSNAQLTQQLAVAPPLSPEAIRSAETRLAKAEQFMDAVENRLTNATAILNTLQAAAQQTAPGSGPSFLPRRSPSPLSSFTGSGVRNSTALDNGANSVSLAETLQASSSHTSEGQLQRRSWGPEQLLGPPDTHSAGDLPTAWAPASSQGKGEEWLHLNYDRSVEVSEVRVRETHNPGAISKIAAMMPDGREVVVWEGTEPKAEPPVDMTFSVPQGVSANSIKVYLDRARVPGWNEIDAVELIGRDGSRQWASSAKTSSSYAEPRTSATALNSLYR